MSEQKPDSKKKSLEYSIKDGAAFSVMTGFGEQYFSPLAIELGASNTQIGLLSAVPVFLASIPQLYTSKVAGYIQSRKKTITRFTTLQCLVWVPLILIPLLGVAQDIDLLIFLVTLYFILGQFPAPVWNSLMGDLVDENVRGRFFGTRNKVTGAVAFISIFAAGFVLSISSKSQILHGFAAIFTVALAARLISWHYLKRMDDPPTTFDKSDEFSFTEYLKKLSHTNYGKFAIYAGLMNYGVNIAGPFFTVYMLRDLRLTYLEYTVLTATVAMATFLAMTYWGRIADKFGNKKVLSMCGILVPVVPILWLFSDKVAYLVFAQIVSGFAWAGFNLSSANFIFDNVRPTKRTRVFSYHNIVVGTSVLFGALTGVALARTMTAPLVFNSNLPTLFLISGLMRAAASLYFLPKIKEVRHVEPVTTRDMFLKYSGTGPILGPTYRVITSIHKGIRRVNVGKGSDKFRLEEN